MTEFKIKNKMNTMLIVTMNNLNIHFKALYHVNLAIGVFHRP